MALRIRQSVRNAMLAAVRDAVDAGSGPGTIEIRTGAQPATPETAASGTLLATFVLADPSFETPSAGSMDIDANPDLTCTAANTGTAGYARVKDSTGVAIFDGSVATSGGDFTISTTSIVSGETLTLTVGALTI
jgi:hypothetical protein